jgi:hypothetical protein
MGSCDPQKQISYYTNKINIYDNDCFIPMPSWRYSLPPPPGAYFRPLLLASVPNKYEIPCPPPFPFPVPVPTPLPINNKFNNPQCGIVVGCNSCGK